jgi:hypothetical protein
MVQSSKLELGLAEDITVDICHAQTLAWRLLDPGLDYSSSALGSSLGRRPRFGPTFAALRMPPRGSGKA